jgi:dipeptidyl-peptidase-4
MLDLNVADPATGKMQTLVHERADTWVNVLGQPHWLADGSFLWSSERTGFKHVYRHAADGKLLGAVTSGDWQVRDVLKVDESKQQVWFTATKDGAAGNHAYRVGLDGKDLVRLTSGAGTHRVSVNGDGSLFLDVHGNLATPPEQRLCRADGEVVKVLGKATRTGLEYATPELLEVPARDGFRMDALWIKPSPLVAGRKYPVWLETYAGPDAPTVRDDWRPSAWHQFLSQQGVVVFQVNNRSASGKGQKYTGACYRSFGKSELADIEDALEWLGRQEWVDASRVGISGWSYGGTMAAYALTHSGKFQLGIAGAGVYDWRLYDSIYTERYMGLPEANAAGYRESSVIENAAKLQGHLVILHGMVDDNVHFQNAVQLVHALQKAGKDEFTVMMYPGSEHGLRTAEQQRHMRRLVWRKMREVLGAGEREG